MRSAVLLRQFVRPSVSLSVGPSVRYRGYIDWNTLKVISQLISLAFPLAAYLNITDLFQREHPEI